MGVDNKHPSYQKFRFQWRMVRDSIDGEASVKLADTVYLPMPSAMLTVAANGPSTQFGMMQSMRFSDSVESFDDYWNQYDPNWHWNPAYSAYKKRAHFPQLVANTARGLLGLATVKEPVVEMPSAVEYFETDATRSGMDLNCLYKAVLREGIQVGRGGVLVDVDDGTDTLYASLYKAESIINWKEQVIDGRRVISYIVLREWTDDTDDEFSHERIPRYRVLRLRGGVYQVEIYDKGQAEPKVVTPTYRGRTLSFIPFVPIGSTDITTLDVDEIPLIGVTRVAHQIYMKNADLSQAEFMSCNPTLFISGVDEKKVPSVVGSNVIVGLENPDAKAYYPKTDTSALAHVAAHIEALFDEAMQYGMGLVTVGKNMAESAESLRLQQSSRGASLYTIVEQAGYTIDTVLKIVTDWSGLDPAKASFVPNRSFANSSLTANEMQSLLQAWMGGGISWHTYVANMRKAGFVAADVDDDEEQDRIKTGPKPPAKALPNDPAARNTEEVVGSERSDGEREAGRLDQQ